MIGKEILNYIIVSRIGSGGMGTVYLAEHKFIKQQKVAIKVIHNNMVNEASKQRLHDEAEKLASLNHPNIVKFLNYHIDEEGNVYLIMEYADGITLEEYIRTKTGLIVESKIWPILEPVLDAFEYAHKHKVVHRDIKPSNIIITTDGVPKILDFGISTIMDDSHDSESQEAFIMGTPSYMSPEQVKGKGIDFRSDIYSLGVLLHQMLTGNAPYDTTTMSELDIQAKVISDPLPRMKSYYRYVSDKIQAVVDKATAKEPQNRYQTCSEFRRAAKKVLVPDPIPISTIAILSVVVCLLVGGGILWWDYSRVKTRYYKDYVEQWGVPQGIGKVSSKQKSHMSRLYKFEYQNYKLQRVSHINSLGNVIDDGESERYERPLDMRFQYSDSKKVSRVKVYDRGGKILYVKSYNDKLNSVVFQYDDEYGTEKSLSAQTIGYVNSLNSSDAKGKISRWLIDYDENGYVSTISYAGYQNQKVGDAHNIYGRKYVRDEKGRVSEEHYLGYDGNPKATKWGLGIKKFYFNENDDWVKAEYYTVDWRPAMDDSDGTYAFVLEYDRWGNVVNAYHKDHSGNLILPKKSGIAGIRSVYDEKGFAIEQTVLDVDGGIGFQTDGGFARVVKKYDENGYLCEQVNYDADGNVCIGTFGCAKAVYKNDDKGNTVEAWFYGLKDELVECTEGNAGFKAEYDANGNLIQQVYYGVDGNPCLMENGTAGIRLEYNDMGLHTKYTNLDTALMPSFDNNGVAITRLEYDNRGNLVRRAFYGADDTSLVLSAEKIAGWKSVYDDNGNETERSFFNTKEERCVCDEGYAKVIYTYDENGNMMTYRYYSLAEKLVLCDGIAGYDYIYDDRGNTIETKPVGVDQKLASGKLISRYKYDENDNEIEFALYDRDNAPAENTYDYHKCTYSYNSRNQLTEIRYYNTSGKLTTYNDDYYSIQKNEYDDKGNRVKCYYYGTNEKPVCCEEGWASSAYEYDYAGHITRQLFYGINGKPTDPKIMVPEGICQYDKWGNMTYLAAADGNGNMIINPNTGWSAMRTEYDLKGNVLNRSYYNEKDTPMLTKDGYHKETSKYTSFGEIAEKAYWGVDGSPVMCNENYHREIYEYNSDQKTVKIYYLDTKGKAVNCSSGYQSIKFEWEGNTVTSRKYYAANGSSVYAESWNGSAWVADRSTALRTLMAELNKSCPMDMGEDFGYMVYTSGKAVGGSSCHFYFKVPYSKYEMSYDKQAEYKSYATVFLGAIKELMASEISISGISMIGILKDSKGRELGKVNL